MLITKLRNQFLEGKTHQSRIKYNKKRNMCASINRKSKRSYYENDMKNLIDLK